MERELWRDGWFDRDGSIEMAFGVWGAVGPSNHVLHGDPDLPRKGAVLGRILCPLITIADVPYTLLRTPTASASFATWRHASGVAFSVHTLNTQFSLSITRFCVTFLEIMLHGAVDMFATCHNFKSISYVLEGDSSPFKSVQSTIAYRWNYGLTVRHLICDQEVEGLIPGRGVVSFFGHDVAFYRITSISCFVGDISACIMWDISTVVIRSECSNEHKWIGSNALCLLPLTSCRHYSKMNRGFFWTNTVQSTWIGISESFICIFNRPMLSSWG